MSLAVQIVLLFILLLLSGFFSSAEVALISLPRSKVQSLLKRRKFAAHHIERLKEQPDRMLSAILLGNNVANIAAASLMTVVMLQLFGDYAVGIATGVMTILILIFGEITPKAIATRYNVQVSQMVSPVIVWMSVFFSPLLWFFDKVVGGILKFFGLTNKQISVTEDEIRHIVDTAEEEGSIQAIERNLIKNVLEFDETTVEEIITPIGDVIMLPHDAKVDDAIKLAAVEKHSRMPVFEDQRGNIIGILSIRDILGKRKTTPVRSIMKKPFVVPESKNISQLLRTFQKRKEHLAMAVDEHGTVVGIVTLEDVLEEIVGEIMDEADNDALPIKKTGKLEWEVQGRAEIMDVNKQLKLRIPDGEYDTIGGFILEKLGHIPAEGEELRHGRSTLIILDVKQHRIEKIQVKK